MNERVMQFIEQEHLLQAQPQVFVIANNVQDAIASQEKIERKGGMRLTNVMRESIMNKVYDFKFKRSGEKLDAQEFRLSHRAMVSIFGRTALEQLEKIGPPYAYGAHNHDGTKLTEQQMVDWRGTPVSFRVGELGYSIALRVKDPLPGSSYGSHSKKFTVKPGELADAILQWQADVEEWKKQKREMQLKVNAVLNSVTTFTSLQKTWPAGERFYKHLPLDFPFRNQVPAVKVDDLNSALGI